MRILIHGLNFYPELTGIGKYTGEMAAYLAEHGQQVRVVTTPPYYPHWQIQRGYSGFAYRKEIWNGIEIYRCPLWVPRKPSGATRMIHLSSFGASSLPVMLAQIGWHPDLIFTIAPAIASTPVAWLTARLAGCKSWLHIQDFELDAALRLNMVFGLRMVGRLFQWSERALLRGFDRVSTISHSMGGHLGAKGVPAERIRLLPNWVEDDRIFPLGGKSHLRAEWGIEADKILVLYSGSMGQKQGLEVLIGAAKELIQEDQIVFAICGDGSARPSLEMQAAGLKNVLFFPLQPLERLNDLLNAADIHVLPQLANAAGLVMPSKLGGMLASGKAVIATAHQVTELAEVVSRVGMVVPPQDPLALANAILRLYQDRYLRVELGERGRQYIQAQWSKEQVLGNILNEFSQLVEK